MIGCGEVWVVIEQCEGELTDLSLEVLGEGRRVANDSHRELGAVLIGGMMSESEEGEKRLSEKLASYGAENIYFIEHPLLADHNNELYTFVLVDLIRKYRPFAVIFGATANSRDWASCIAARLHVGCAQDSLRLKAGGEVIEITRPVYESKVYKTVTSHLQPHIATILRDVVGIDEPDRSRKAKNVVRMQPCIHYDVLRVKRVQYFKADPRIMDIRDSEIIVAGGRGIGNNDGWRLIEEFANVIGGSVAGSRMALDNGWITRDRLVGQTGKTVNAKVYIACGISGAINHLVGMKNCKLIVAINIDERAPITKLAHIVVIGDLYQIIPALIKQMLV